MKLWVDDLRPAPSGWAWAKTSVQAIAYLSSQAGDVETISLDHDLGGDDTTRAVVLWLCEDDGRWPREVRVHTANPVGRRWLLGMIERYQPVCSGSTGG